MSVGVCGEIPFLLFLRLGCVTDNVKYHYACHFRSAPIQKQYVGAVGLDIEGLTNGQIFFNQPDRFGGEWNEPLLIPFPCYKQVTLFKI